MTPIIIPMNTTTKVDCIIQEGIRYCEKQDISSHEGGIIALSVAGAILWFMFWFWLGIKLDDEYNIFPLTTVFLGGLVLPAIITGIVLLF